MRPATAASWLPRIVFFADLAHEVGALVRRAPVAHGVAEAVVDVDPLRLVCLQDGGKRLIIGVGIAKTPRRTGGAYHGLIT
jgi:hypothetical protein